MGNLSFERTEEDGSRFDWLVIPFDRPIQAGACSIVGLASVSIRPATFVIPGRERFASEPGISRFRVWSFGPSRNDVLRLHQPRTRTAGLGILVAVGQRQIGFRAHLDQPRGGSPEFARLIALARDI